LDSSCVFTVYETRRRAVLDAILRLLPGVPWVEAGTFSWLVGPKGEYLSLDLFFPDMPLAVDVYDRVYASWERVRDVVDRPVWEYLRSQEAAKTTVLRKLRVPYLRIYWDDPISESWLAMELDAVLASRRA